MKPITLFKTESKNNYFYSNYKNRFYFSHPILQKILNFYNSNYDIEAWLDNLKDTDITLIEGYGEASKKQILYYYEKFKFFRENNLLIAPKPEDSFIEITKFDIESEFANAKIISFEVTDACNLKCEYCAYGKYYNKYDKRVNKKMDIKKAIAFLEYLSKYKNSNYNNTYKEKVMISFYGGEPLLNMKFIKEIVEYVKQNEIMNTQFVFGMTSNGILLDKHIDFLVEHDFDLMISLDGNKENNSYRVFHNGKASFDILEKNLKKLRKEHPKYFEKIKFNVVLHNRNSVSEVYNYFKKEYNMVPMITDLNAMGIEKSMKVEFWEMYRNVYESLNQAEDYELIVKDNMLNPDKSVLQEILSYSSGNFFNSYNSLMKPTSNKKFCPTGTCKPFSRNVFITVNGKILPCVIISHEHSLGHIDDKVNIDFQGIANKMNSYYKNITKSCKSCYNYTSCVQCIFELDIKDPNVKCHGLSKYSDRTKFLSKNISILENNPDEYHKIMEELKID